MRFIHTADWQIGMKSPGLGHAAARVREERLAAGRRVVQAARDQEAEFILIAGDLFEDNAVDRVLVQQAADILRGFGGPVYLIPGNHDPLAPGSVWEHPAWRAANNVAVLGAEEAVEVPGGALYPCPVREKHSGRNPTGWILPGAKGGIRLGLAHGTVEGVRQDEPDYPIPRDAAVRADLDYLALGHWHSFAAYPEPDGRIRMAYSGTPETSRFGERDSGNILLVEIPTPGVPVRVTPLRTGGLSWVGLAETVRAGSDLERLRQQLEELPDPAVTLVSVTLTGLLCAAEQPELEHIGQIVMSRFLHGQLDASGLRPAPGDDSWVAGLPPGVVREAAGRLQALAAGPGVEAAAAARALMELYDIAQRVAR